MCVQTDWPLNAYQQLVAFQNTAATAPYAGWSVLYAGCVLVDLPANIFQLMHNLIDTSRRCCRMLLHSAGSGCCHT
jgi:hypothetical protein